MRRSNKKKNPVTPALASVGDQLPFPSYFLSLLFSLLLLLCLPNFYSDLFYSSISEGITLHGFFLLWSFSMHPTKIVRRLLAYPPTWVFPTPLLSLCCMSVPTMSFVGFQEFHTDSWLLSFNCRLSLIYGYAHVANRGLYGVCWGSAQRWARNQMDWLALEWWRKLWKAVEASGFRCLMLSLGLTVFGLICIF